MAMSKHPGVRYALSISFFIIALIGYVFFEYWKLTDEGIFYLAFGAVGSGSCFLGIYLLFSTPNRLSRDRVKISGIITAFFCILEFGILRWQAQSELNHVIHAKGRCESVLTDLFRNQWDGMMKDAKNECVLRILHEQWEKESLSDAQAQVVQVGALLASEGQLNETTLVLLLADYSTLETDQKERELGRATPWGKAKTQFDLLEGCLPLFEVYQVVSAYEDEASVSESARLKKLVEISTLAKTLGIFLSKEQAGRAAYHEFSLAPATGLLSSSDVTLLQMRMQLVHERFEKVRKHWNLPGVLDSLKLKTAFPDQVGKVSAEVAALEAKSI